jgi:DNA-binding MarR family transcriptional regulator
MNKPLSFSMDPENPGRSAFFLQRFHEMNPKPFKSFISKFINERVGETGLTESQIVFLTILDDEKGMSLKEMTEWIGVDKSLTTRAVKHLLEHGFVINIAESGKEHSIVLTIRGVKAKETAHRAFAELFEILLEDVTDEEMLAMEQGLSKIRLKMDELLSKEQGTD